MAKFEAERIKHGILSHLKQDIPASIVVLFVALPLCLGIALASGAPLFSGLIAGIIGGIVVGSISDSAHGVSGPAAGLAVVVFEALHTMSFEIFLLAVVIGGVLQIVLGLSRAGIIGYFFPSAAIKGMLSGIGIIIILKQIPHAFGYDKEWMGSESFIQLDGENTFTLLWKLILGHVTPGAVLIATISIVILLLWELYLTKKYHNVFKLIQGPIVVVAAAICCQLITKSYFPQYTVGPSTW